MHVSGGTTARRSLPYAGAFARACAMTLPETLTDTVSSALRPRHAVSWHPAWKPALPGGHTVIRTLLTEEDGFAMTEYALILGLVSVGAMSALIALGGRLHGIIDLMKTKLGLVPG